MNISKTPPPDPRDKVITNKQNPFKDPTIELTNPGESKVYKKFMEKDSHDNLCQINEKPCLQIPLVFKAILSPLCILG